MQSKLPRISVRHSWGTAKQMLQDGRTEKPRANIKMTMKISRFWSVLLLAVFICCIHFKAAAVDYVVAKATIINAGGQNITLSEGQSVSVIEQSNGMAVIKIVLPSGSMTIGKIPSANLRQAAAQTTKPATPAPTPAIKQKTEPITPSSVSGTQQTTTVAAVSRVSGADWPQWRGPDRNGIASGKINWPSPGPKQLWKAAVGEGYSSVAIRNGRAYTMGNADGQDTVWCLDAKTGAVVWKYSYPCPAVKDYPGPRVTPTVDGNLVYTVSRNGNLFALDAAKGAVVWSADYVKDFGAKLPRWGFAGSPLVDGKLLLVNAGGAAASVVAFDKSAGQVVWKSGTDVAGYSSPVIATLGDQRIVLMFSATGLYGYNLADGKELWNAKWTTPAGVNASDPMVFGDKVFLTSGYGSGCTLLKITNTSAEEVYKNRDFSSLSGNTVFIGGFLYGYTGKSDAPVLACLDPNTGVVKWKNAKAGGSLIAAGNNLIIQAYDGSLIVAEADPAAYKEIGRATVLTGACMNPPSLANGCVYCRNEAGDVVCLDMSASGGSNEAQTVKPNGSAPAEAAKTATGAWVEVTRPKANKWPYGVITVDRAKGNLYFSTCFSGLWRSSDSGKTWDRLGNDKFFPDKNIPGSVVIDGSRIVVFNSQENHPPVIATVTPNANAYSLDEGKTWEPMQHTQAGFVGGSVEPGKGQAVLVCDNAAQAMTFSPDLGKTWNLLGIGSRDVKGLGVFSAQELLFAAKSGGIKFSSDGGKTWVDAAPFDVNGDLLIVKGMGVWLSSKGLVVTKDHGKTWSIQGTPPPAALIAGLPAVLGKDENHFFALTVDGLAETRDLGKTWKILAPLPAAPALCQKASYVVDFDPVHDLFYIIPHFHGPHSLMAYHWQK